LLLLPILDELDHSDDSNSEISNSVSSENAQLTLGVNCWFHNQQLHVLAFDGERIYKKKYYSPKNITMSGKNKHYMRTDKKLHDQEMVSFAMLHCGIVGNWVCIDRCVARESPSADYPKGRPCIVVRLMLTTCDNPHMTMLICYTDMDVLGDIGNAFRFIKLRKHH
jgi:hypothetical protein